MASFAGYSAPRVHQNRECFKSLDYERRHGFGGGTLQNICIIAVDTRRLKNSGSQDCLPLLCDPVTLATAKYHAARPRPGVLARLDNLDSVHQHLRNTGGVLDWLFEGGVVLDRPRIENHHIGEI
jgi:hypothetical protein